MVDLFRSQLVLLWILEPERYVDDRILRELELENKLDKSMGMEIPEFQLRHTNKVWSIPLIHLQ